MLDRLALAVAPTDGFASDGRASRLGLRFKRRARGLAELRI